MINMIKVDNVSDFKQKTKVKAKELSNKAWKLAKSDEALGVLKIAAAGVALVHAVEELRLMKKQIGFKK